MFELKSYKKILNLYGKENLFDFENEEHIFVIVGYPHWRAYIISTDKDYRIEVFPRINVLTKKFEFLEDPQKDDDKKGAKLEKINLCVEDADIFNLYLERERQFFETIPNGIIDRVKVFSDSHWEIIKGIVDYGHKFLTLINSNPVLAYLLVRF